MYSYSMKKRNWLEKSFIGGKNYILIVFFVMYHSQNDFFAARNDVF